MPLEMQHYAWECSAVQSEGTWGWIRRHNSRSDVLASVQLVDWVVKSFQTEPNHTQGRRVNEWNDNGMENVQNEAIQQP